MLNIYFMDQMKFVINPKKFARDVDFDLNVFTKILTVL